MHEPISDPATPSSETQEDYQQPNSTSGGNNRTTSTATPRKKFDRTTSTATPRKKFHRTRTIALDDDELVERKTEKSKVIDLIGKPTDKQGCKVISIWGMGGLGKTTLVRSIYRTEQLGGWKRAWVPALRPFNPEVLMRTLVLQLLTNDPTAASETKLKVWFSF